MDALTVIGLVVATGLVAGAATVLVIGVSRRRRNAADSLATGGALTARNEGTADSTTDSAAENAAAEPADIEAEPTADVATEPIAAADAAGDGDPAGAVEDTEPTATEDSEVAGIETSEPAAETAGLAVDPTENDQLGEVQLEGDKPTARPNRKRSIRRRKRPQSTTATVRAAEPGANTVTNPTTADSGGDAGANPTAGSADGTDGRHVGEPLTLDREVLLAATGSALSRARHAGEPRDERADAAEADVPARIDPRVRTDAA